MAQRKRVFKFFLKKQLDQASNLLIAADVNAVPPPLLGIEGVGVHDMGVELPDTPEKALGIGALAVSDIKYKVHFTMFEMMKNTDESLHLDHEKAFDVAREFAAKL